jgi:hypothetical protein
MKRIDIKRIIEGKIYDTATATLICDTTDYNITPDTCDDEFRSDLYVTAKGAYFLAGKRKISCKQEPHDDLVAHQCWHKERWLLGQWMPSGECILPIPEGEALRQAVDSTNTDTVEKFFGDILEDA